MTSVGRLHLLDGPGDGGALARPGDAEQGLEAVAPARCRRPAPSMAWGWSPAAAKSDTTLNGHGSECDPVRSTGSSDLLATASPSHPTDAGARDVPRRGRVVRHGVGLPERRRSGDRADRLGQVAALGRGMARSRRDRRSAASSRRRRQQRPCSARRPAVASWPSRRRPRVVDRPGRPRRAARPGWPGGRSGPGRRPRPCPAASTSRRDGHLGVDVDHDHDVRSRVRPDSTSSGTSRRRRRRCRPVRRCGAAISAATAGWTMAFRSAPGLGVGEHDGGQRRPVEACRRRPTTPGPKRSTMPSNTGVPGCLELPGDGVGVDDERAPRRQQGRHGRLARPDAAGEPDEQHGGDPVTPPAWLVAWRAMATATAQTTRPSARRPAPAVPPGDHRHRAGRTLGPSAWPTLDRPTTDRAIAVDLVRASPSLAINGPVRTLRPAPRPWAPPPTSSP